MRLFLRITGTWLLAGAFILLVIDGVRSLGASTLLWTALGTTWGNINAQSLEAVREFFASRFFGALLEPAFETLLGLPGFVVLGVPGVLLALMGRSRRTRALVRQDQF